MARIIKEMKRKTPLLWRLICAIQIQWCNGSRMDDQWQWIPALDPIIPSFFRYLHSFFLLSLLPGERSVNIWTCVIFWDDPSIILGQWPRTDWNCLCNSLLNGRQVCHLLNCSFAVYVVLFHPEDSPFAGRKHLYTVPLLFLCRPFIWFYRQNTLNHFAALVFSVSLCMHIIPKRICHSNGW